MSLQVVILAAGLGKRMYSNLPKILAPLGGRPLLAHVLQTAKMLSSLPPIVVYGHQGEQLKKAFAHETINWVYQEKQLGTGHALLQAIPEFKSERILILYGDVPLLSKNVLQKLITTTSRNDIGLLTAKLKHPAGYGRIKRDAQLRVTQIVEEKDASVIEKKINEVNSGICLFPAKFLTQYLPTLQNNNAQQEYYLTDLFAIALKQGSNIVTISPDDCDEIFGVNDSAQLAAVERRLQKREVEFLLQQGVKIADPNRLDVRGNVIVGRDVFLDIDVILEGDVHLGDGCYIGPFSYIKNSHLHSNVYVKSHSVIEDAKILDACTVGPFARIRPGTELQEKVHIGNFVEVKNSKINSGTKINHLSYVGDSDVGKNVNIGAGTITCNYDGYSKNKTIIEDNVNVGSVSTLVAPVTIGKDAFIASNTTIRKSVPSGCLVYNPKEEKYKLEWTQHRKQKKATAKDNKVCVE